MYFVIWAVYFILIQFVSYKIELNKTPAPGCWIKTFKLKSLSLYPGQLDIKIKCQFYIGFFSNIDQIKPVHLISLYRVSQLPYNVQGNTHSLAWCLMNSYLLLLLNIAQTDIAIKTRNLAKGHKHIGDSRTYICCLVIQSHALFHRTTCTR